MSADSRYIACKASSTRYMKTVHMSNQDIPRCDGHNFGDTKLQPAAQPGGEITMITCSSTFAAALSV